MSNARFTAWLSEDERAAVSERAKQLGASDNYVVRVCIRAALGMPIPDEFIRPDQTVQTETETEREPA